MSADALLKLVRLHDHRQCVPAHQALDPALHLLAAGKGRLLANRNCVLVGRGRRKRQIHASGATGMKSQLLEQASGAFSAAFRENVIERIEPFASFYDFESVCRLSLLRLQRISHSDLTPVGDGIFYDKQSAEILLTGGQRSQALPMNNDGCCERLLANLHYSSVTDFTRFRGRSTSSPLLAAT